MNPFRGAPVSCKADVYSFGVTLWQLARRATPYAGREMWAIIFAVVDYNDRPDSPAPSGPRASVPTPVADSSFVDEAVSTPTDSVIDKCCWSANPEARPTTAQLATAFNEWKAFRDT